MPTLTDRPRTPRWQCFLLSTLFIGMVTALSGCGEPTVREVKNARAFEALLTAVSLRNEEEVDRDAKLIEERRAAGELSHSEYREISEIIAKARAKDWARAEKQAYSFRERNPSF